MSCRHCRIQCSKLWVGEIIWNYVVFHLRIRIFVSSPSGLLPGLRDIDVLTAEMTGGVVSGFGGNWLGGWTCAVVEKYTLSEFV